MKWCIFVNRKCCGEDCVGWIENKCFVYALLPIRFSNEQDQTEFNWSEDESHLKTDGGSLKLDDYQLSFFSEMERQIVQRASD